MKSGVAAGHPATCEAGIEILEDGGSAADAAVAACLASCVAETVMTGLLGGGHAIYWDAGSKQARNLDCFVAVPSGVGAPMVELHVPFGEELVHYAIGAASCGVSGVAAGMVELWRAHGRLPWERLVEPALRLARDGVPVPPAHVRCLEMLEPVLTLDAGARIYAPGGKLLRDGELLEQPGLVCSLELLRDEGAESVYSGSIAEALLALCAERGGHQRSRGGEDQRGIEFRRRRLVAAPGPGRSQAPGERLCRNVARACEGVDLLALGHGDLADDVRRRPESPQADPVRGGAAGEPPGAKADQAGAQQRRRVQVVDVRRQGEAETHIRHRVLGVTAVPVVAGEERGVAQGLAGRAAVGTGPAGAA